MKLIDELREDLAAFVEQRESLTLVLWTKSPTDTLYALKLLESLEEVSDRDMFLLFTEDCYDPERYLDALMAACDMEIDTGNGSIDAGAGSEDAVRWEGLPSACYQESLSVQARFRALVEHIRRYYPDPAHRIVFALLPREMSTPGAYATFLRALVPTDGYEPWMAGVRIIATDSQRAPQIVPEFTERPDHEVLIRLVDFSVDALSRAIVEQVDDPATPEDQRMLSLVQVAALDHAWKRYPDALAKYGQAYAYYLREQNHAMQAVSLLFAGHTLEQMQQPEPAKEKYRQSLELGLSNDIKQVVLNALLALAAAHQREEDWRGAAEFWTGAAFSAKEMGNVFVMADASENAGLCHVALDELPQAFELWTAAQAVATGVGYWDRVVSVLEQRVEVERRRGMDEERATHTRELEAALAQREVQRHEAAQARAGAGMAS